MATPPTDDLGNAGTVELAESPAQSVPASAHDEAAHAHPPHLAHHFDTPSQQFEAAKLGMWLFLGTEVLLFGGLFCLYVIFRTNHPELFEYGSRFLDTTWGAINTVVLILSSLTMAIAVWCAQTGHRRHLAFFLLLTLLFAGDFLVVKYLEYTHKIQGNLVWGTKLYETPPGWAAQEEQEAATPAPDEPIEALEPAAAPDANLGRDLWMGTCRSCHGVTGEGIPGQGKDIRNSEFILEKTDDELLAFVKAGRMPFDPLNTTGIQMPPKGGNPMLKDDDLRAIIEYLRSVMGTAGETPALDEEAAAEEEEFWIPESVIPPAAEAPAGMSVATLEWMERRTNPPPPAAGPPTHPSLDPDRPANAHMFFAIYFLMTGLHGIHVLAGMCLIGWLLVRTLRGHFGTGYFTPVDLGGLYWHVVDLIWIFLFPLFYLVA